jgi:hypothetical protein
MSAPVGDAAARSLQAKSIAAKHRATTTMSSMDLSEESRDTVEVKDSDQWFPQFSPSATLGPVKKLESSKQEGLSALLQNRMDRARFQERFLKPGSEEEKAANAALAMVDARTKTLAKEASSESLFNRSAKLGALLANRPSKDRLENLNIIKTSQGSVKSLPTSAFAGRQAELEASKKKDKLNALLAARPSFDEVTKRGIRHDEQKSQLPRERVRNYMHTHKHRIIHSRMFAPKSTTTYCFYDLVCCNVLLAACVFLLCVLVGQCQECIG